jgi:hypothetical protein
LDRADPSHAKIMKALIDELNFYLVELDADPWTYAQYHARTMSNAISSIHWSFFPKHVRSVTAYVAELDVKPEQDIGKALRTGKITNIKPV